jgi:hypothetical protein
MAKAKKSKKSKKAKKVCKEVVENGRQEIGEEGQKGCQENSQEGREEIRQEVGQESRRESGAEEGRQEEPGKEKEGGSPEAGGSSGSRSGACAGTRAGPELGYPGAVNPVMGFVQRRRAALGRRQRHALEGPQHRCGPLRLSVAFLVRHPVGTAPDFYGGLIRKRRCLAAVVLHCFQVRDAS